MRAAVLFSGIGGWELAAEQLGITTVWAAEWNQWKAARYRERFPATSLYRDVRGLDGRELIAAHGPIDILLGSPPCTDISQANHRARGLDGEASRHYLEAIRLVAELRPRWAVFENSDKLRARGADRVLTRLEAEGYACWPLVVGALHAGAPHERRRSFVIAADADQIGLRQQPRRRRRANGQGATIAHVDADTDRQGQPLLPLYGEMAWGSGADGADRGGAHDTNANSKQRRTRSARQDRSQARDIPVDPDRQSLAVGESFCGDVRARNSPTERADHLGWRDRSASLACHLRVADGVPAGLCGKWRSAFGDAVVVPVVRAVLQGVLAADRAR